MINNIDLIRELRRASNHRSWTEPHTTLPVIVVTNSSEHYELASIEQYKVESNDDALLDVSDQIKAGDRIIILYAV